MTMKSETSPNLSIASTVTDTMFLLFICALHIDNKNVLPRLKNQFTNDMASSPASELDSPQTHSTPPQMQRLSSALSRAPSQVASVVLVHSHRALPPVVAPFIWAVVIHASLVSAIVG